MPSIYYRDLKKPTVNPRKPSVETKDLEPPASRLESLTVNQIVYGVHQTIIT